MVATGAGRRVDLGRAASAHANGQPAVYVEVAGEILLLTELSAWGTAAGHIDANSWRWTGRRYVASFFDMQQDLIREWDAPGRPPGRNCSAAWQRHLRRNYADEQPAALRREAERRQARGSALRAWLELLIELGGLPAPDRVVAQRLLNHRTGPAEAFLDVLHSVLTEPKGSRYRRSNREHRW